VFVDEIRGEGIPPRWKQAPLTLPKIESAIRALDGKGLSEVLLLNKSGGFLAVAGGGGYYKVSASPDGVIVYSIRSPSESDDIIELIAAGQRVKASRNTVASLKETLVAAATFAEHGGLDSSLVWEKN
jgi:hypothetical protein